MANIFRKSGKQRGKSCGTDEALHGIQVEAEYSVFSLQWRMMGMFALSLPRNYSVCGALVYYNHANRNIY